MGDIDADVVEEDDFIEELIEAENEGKGVDYGVVSAQELLFIADQGSVVWMVLCIVFILLFGIALLAIAFLASFVWNMKKNELNGANVAYDDDDKDELECHQRLASKSQAFSAGDNVLANV